MTTHVLTANRSRPVLKPALWVTQVLLALFFAYAGYLKLATPLDQLAKMLPWAGSYPSLVKLTGVVDLLGGIGILLPALTRIQPRLTVLAALGLIVLQVLAMGFHIWRGEVFLAPMNAVLIALAAFVYWGRSRSLPFTLVR